MRPFPDAPSRYGRWTFPWLSRSLMPAGKMRRYESSVVEVARYSTTVNVLAALALPESRYTAASMKIVETMPDITFTRTGVPRRGWKRPK